MWKFWALKPVIKGELPSSFAGCGIEQFIQRHKRSSFFPWALLSYWPEQRTEGVSIVKQLLLSTYCVAGALLAGGDKEVRNMLQRCHEDGLQ